jgi:hypothetical protein
MPTIVYLSGGVLKFNSVEEMEEYIFDRGFKEIGDDLYFEVEDCVIRKVAVKVN